MLARKAKRPRANVYLVTIAAILAAALVGIAILSFRPGPADSADGQIRDRSKICMLQDTVQAKSGLTYVYNGKKYYLCCGGCLAGFQRDPATRSHATDPVDGRSVDKADAPAYAYQGRAYFFSSDSNMRKFVADPQNFLARSPSQAAQR